MKTTLIFAFLAAFVAAQKGTGGAKGSGGAGNSAAAECFKTCATTAFGVEATTLTAANIPCAKEYSSSPEGYKSPEFKGCICKDAKVQAAVTCQGKCQYGSMVQKGFKSFCG